MLMRILICDDDALAREQIQSLITEYFEEKHVACPEISCFSDGESLLSDEGEKDILFLDVEMSGLNGIFVGNTLKKKYKNIIIFIVTSYPEYLDDAMRFHVFRYLSKPLDKKRFFRNLADALNYYHTMIFKLVVETKQCVHTFPASSVIAVETRRRKVIVHTVLYDLESIHNMQYWQQRLPKNSFFCTHRSFIVNLAHVLDFDHTTIHLTLDIHAYLTKRRYSEFKDAYLLYLESMG